MFLLQNSKNNNQWQSDSMRMHCWDLSPGKSLRIKRHDWFTKGFYSAHMKFMLLSTQLQEVDSSRANFTADPKVCPLFFPCFRVSGTPRAATYYKIYLSTGSNSNHFTFICVTVRAPEANCCIQLESLDNARLKMYVKLASRKKHLGINFNAPVCSPQY